MTWSIIHRERDSGRIAIAVATKFFAVGARVPYVAPQKGAVCTQALLNPLYGPAGLRLIREGVGAADVVRLLTANDEGREHRQVHVLGADGKPIVVNARDGVAVIDEAEITLKASEDAEIVLVETDKLN